MRADEAEAHASAASTGKGGRNLPGTAAGAEARTAAGGRTKPEGLRLMEAAVERSNMLGAYERVVKNHCVSGAKAETQSECRQKRSGPTVAAEVSGLQCHVAPESEAENRTSQPPTLGRENPPDVAWRSGPKCETSHRRTQPHIARLGCLLPAHRRKRGAGGRRQAVDRKMRREGRCSGRTRVNPTDTRHTARNACPRGSRACGKQEARGQVHCLAPPSGSRSAAGKLLLIEEKGLTDCEWTKVCLTG